MKSKEQLIKEMAQRFLSWKLPKDFCPDGDISFTSPPTYQNTDGKFWQPWPTGTNLLDARQAEEMIKYIFEVDTEIKKDKKPEELKEPKVLTSSRLTSFWCNEEQKTVVVTMLFWSDGSVTWVKE